MYIYSKPYEDNTADLVKCFHVVDEVSHRKSEDEELTKKIVANFTLTQVHLVLF